MHYSKKHLVVLIITILFSTTMLAFCLPVTVFAISGDNSLSIEKATASVRTIYVRTSEMIEGESYLIVGSVSEEEGYALSHTGEKIETVAVIIHTSSEDDFAENDFIKAEDVDSGSVWTATHHVLNDKERTKLINNDYALSPNGGTYYNELIARATTVYDAFGASFTEGTKYTTLKFDNGGGFRILKFRINDYNKPEFSVYSNNTGISNSNNIHIYKKIDIHVHSLVYHKAQTATCTEIGWNAYYTCSSCNYTTYAEIPPLGHDLEDVVAEATCTEQGYTTHTCLRCGDSYADTFIKALGHNMELIPARVSGCEEDGCIRHYECARCGGLFLDEAGQTILDREDVFEPATGHAWNDTGTVTKEATCTEDGIITYTCANDPTHKRTEVIPATGHTAGETVIENHISADCTTPESYDEVVYCTVCGEELSSETKIGESALGHNIVLVLSKGATCEENGNSRHYKCERCGKLFIDAQGKTEIDPESVVIPATGHEHAETVTAPTCTAKGYTTHTCMKCGSSYNDSFTNALGHDYEEVLTDSTCTEGGYTTHTCSRCGDSYVDTLTEALSHSWNDGEITTEPNCTEEGERTYTCTRCDTTRTESVEALGHDFHEIEGTAVTATCIEAGKEAEQRCSRCDAVIFGAESPALGHSYHLDHWEWTEDNTRATACFICSNDEEHIVQRTGTAEIVNVTEDGGITKTTYTVTIEFEGETYTDSKEKKEETYKTGWQEEDGEWYYYNSDGTKLTNGWAKDDKGWLWMGADGKITKDKWIEYNGEKYYLKPNGYMAANEWVKDSSGWMYMNSSGRRTRDQWIEYNGEKYYLKSNGYMAANEWAKDSTGWMYMNSSGRPVKDQWIEYNGEKYYLKSNGYMATNEWAKDSTGWKYMDQSGKSMRDKWIKYNGEWYYLKSNGYMAANEWAKDSTGWMYMNSSGKPTKNQWVKSNGEWYYLKSNGYMAANEWAKDSTGWKYMDINGKSIKNQWIKYNGEWYYLKSDGYMAANEWVKDSTGWMYMDQSGRITRSKWVQYNGDWYYLKADGYMATGTVTVGSTEYTFSSSGKLVA